jgi:hypothetical protein
METARTSRRLRGLIPHRAAVIHRRRALTLRQHTLRPRHVPTQRLRAPIPHRAAVMEAAEVEATGEVAGVALTAEAVVADRMEAALTEAVLTDAKISSTKPAPHLGRAFLCLGVCKTPTTLGL